jgi:hypothetical protein
MKTKRKHGRRPAGPVVRLPLPKKAEQRHSDARKYSRVKEKERLRRHTEE